MESKSDTERDDRDDLPFPDPRTYRFFDFAFVKFDFVAQFFHHLLQPLHVLLVLFRLEF